MNRNPGVKLLIRTQIDNKIFSIEERLGEGIYIYWGDSTIKISKNSFSILIKDIIDKNTSLDRGIRELSTSYKRVLLDKILMGYNKEIKDVEEIRKFQKKMVMKYLIEDFPSILKNRSIVLRGAGEHTEKLIELWYEKVNLCGIWAKDLRKEIGITIITEENTFLTS